MSRYRIYILTTQERIARSLETDFADDAAALRGAEDARAGQHAAEVWDGERLVGRLGCEFSLAEAWGANPPARITSGY